jgi:hypothetical protein
VVAANGVAAPTAADVVTVNGGLGAAADVVTVNGAAAPTAADVVAANGVAVPTAADVVAANGVVAPTAADVVTADGQAAGTASDSPANLDGFDVISGFDLAADKLDLPTTSRLTGTYDDAHTGVTDLTVDSITNGVAVFGGAAAGTATVADKAVALLTAMGDGTVSVGFVVGDDSYIVHGDGVMGASDTDMVVKLVGVQVTDLSAFIV